MFNFVPSVIATIQNYDLKLRIICCDYLKKKSGATPFLWSLSTRHPGHLTTSPPFIQMHLVLLLSELDTIRFWEYSDECLHPGGTGTYLMIT